MNNAEKMFERLKDLVGTSLEAIEICKTDLNEKHHELIYVDMLDDIYGEVEICGNQYSAGLALKEVDPVAFRCGLHDFLSENCIELGESYFYDWQIEELIDSIETDMAFGHARVGS